MPIIKKTSLVQESKKVSPGFITIGYNRNQPATVKNLQEWVEESNPHPMEMTSGVRAGGEFATLGGMLFLLISGQNPTAGLLGGVTTLGGMVVTALGFLNEPKLPAKKDNKNLKALIEEGNKKPKPKVTFTKPSSPEIEIKPLSPKVIINKFKFPYED